MTMTFQEMYDEVTHLDAQMRVEAGTRAFHEIWDACTKKGMTDYAISCIVTAVIKVAVSADRLASNEEHDLFNAIFNANQTYKQFYEMTNGGASKEFLESVDNILNDLPEEVREASCILALCFMCADGHVTGKEKAVFEKLAG